MRFSWTDYKVLVVSKVTLTVCFKGGFVVEDGHVGDLGLCHSSSTSTGRHLQRDRRSMPL